MVTIKNDTFFYSRMCKVVYQNWYEGRDPLPVRMAIFRKNEEGEEVLKEDVSVKDRSAVIIRSNGGVIHAAMERKVALIGKYYVSCFSFVADFDKRLS